MPVYTAIARQEAYEYLRWLSRHKVITPAIFKVKKANIDRREAKSVALATTKQVIRQTQILARRRVKTETTALANKLKKEVNSIPNDLLRFKYTTTDSPEDDIRELWRRTQGTTARFISGNIDWTGDVLPGDRGYKAFRTMFMDGSDGYIIEGETTFLVLRPTTIERIKLNQKFREGINHCVFTPLLAKMAASLEESSDATKKRVCQRIKKINVLSVVYADGVPESKMDEIAKVSGMKMVLYDVLGNEIAVYNKDGRLGCLRMTNTRENHIDIGLVVDSDAIKLSQEEMITLWRSIKEKEEFYMIDGDLKEGRPRKIRTLNGAWSIKDPIFDLCAEFDKEIGVMNYKVNALKQPELNDFLKQGRIINGWSTDLNGGEATGCADMPSAYTQFKKCSYYTGFLGHIHQFRSGSFTRQFVEEHLGYYAINVVGGVTELMMKLGLYDGVQVVLFSPELLYFLDNGLQVEIFQGAWGSRFDFDFPEYMMKDRAYCIWAGRLGIEREETSHTISASPEWASHLAVDHKVFYWEKDGLLTIKKPVKQCFTAHHILGAITSYLRIQMMEAMKMFDPSNIVRVVLDGIYYRGEKPQGLEWFTDKEMKSCDNSIPWYNAESIFTAPLVGNIVKNSLLTGQGGSGKTYSVFMDKGFNTVLYVSPSHILGQDVYKKYGAKYTTIHKLIGIDCQPYYTNNRIPPVIFVDEITQIEASWIDKVFSLYPSSLILLAGDIDNTGRWFQCRSGSGKEWNAIWKPVLVDVIEYLEDRRSRDDELKDLKLQIRSVMNKCDLQCGVYEMEGWATTLPISPFNFIDGDICIAGTHKTNTKLLDMGIVSGYYKKGGYVSSVELPGYEGRGSFTIHSYQGKTIETGNIWIFIDDLFEYAMLYTAVSRAVNRSQIKFVKAKSLC